MGTNEEIRQGREPGTTPATIAEKGLACQEKGFLGNWQVPEAGTGQGLVQQLYPAKTY